MAASMGAVKAGAIKVIPVPMHSDNYCYLIFDEASGACAAVDPAEPQKALDAAAAEGWSISIVLTTHKHWDHAGGNIALAAAIPGLTVVGGEVDMVDGCTMPVKDGEEFKLGATTVTCLLTPGHTKGHITYYCAADDERHVFTGDVMFIGGCGKFFEGSATEMYPSLYNKIGTLPDDTLVWPGHEYTVSNLAFAAEVEPDNADILAKAAWAQAQRAVQAFTVPSTIGAERRHNVFLRCSCAAVKAVCEVGEGASDVECLGALRALKDSGRLTRKK